MLTVALFALESFWRRSYSLITLYTQNENPLAQSSFIFCILFFILVIYPFMKRTYPKALLDKKSKEVVRVGAIGLLLTLLTFLPALMVQSLPFDKKEYKVVRVLVEGNYVGQSGGSAPIYALQTTSWRGFKHEEFRSEFINFKNYKKGDTLDVALAKDIFRRARVVWVDRVEDE